MITITKSTDKNGLTKVDQSIENIIKQLTDNTDPLTVELAEDVFTYIIMPQVMQRLGYIKDDKNIYIKTHVPCVDFSLVNWSIT